MTHEALRKAAVKWLTGSKGCGVVLSEIVSACGETPDAIGWKYGTSTVVECKASRAGLRRNVDKPQERSGRAVGRSRYILCPVDMVAADDPLMSAEMAEWGLLWLKEDGRIKVLREASSREGNERQEILMLTSALRRVKMREFIVLVAEPEPVK